MIWRLKILKKVQFWNLKEIFQKNKNEQMFITFSKVLNNSNITQNTGYNEYGKYGTGYNMTSFYKGKYR